jgi:hypothetical protein
MYKDIIDFLKENIVDINFFKNKLFTTKEYKILQGEILDEEIIITNAIPFSEYESSYENTKNYLAKDKVFPFLDTLGGNLIGIGYGNENAKLIYYFDNDFGLFQLDGDDYFQFCKKLKIADYDWL